MTVDKKAHLYACYYYNQGLVKAKARDFSGAIDMLNRSIELDKNYINARNLLGLCLFEIGEVGDALVQWIVSKNILNENPLADRFIGIAQNSPTKLSHYRVAIKKYNTALELVRSGADDLALIQLKRALAKNPNYVKAWQLLALIYMKNEDFDRAKKALRRTLKTDVANPISVRYIREMRNLKLDSRMMELGEVDLVRDDMDVKKVLEGRVNQSLTPNYNYQASKPNYRGFVSLVVGILVGIFTVYALVIPGVKQSLKQERVSIEKKFGDEIAEYLTRLDTLEKENSSISSKLESEEMEKNSLKEQINNLENKKTSNNVLSAYKFFIDMRSSEGGSSDLNKYMLRQKLEAITKEELANENAKALYDNILAAYPKVLEATMSGEALFSAGNALYESEKYEEAVTYFELSYKEAPDNDTCLYYLGRTYHLLNNADKATKYYEEYISKFPSGQYFDTVNQWIAKLEA